MVDFDYWYTLYEYLDKDKLNGDIIHDAKIIARTKYFWKITSHDYLNEIDIEDLLEISSLNIQVFENYVDAYNEFLADLIYSSDRMCANRWLRLQNRIFQCYEMIYKEYNKNYDWTTWWNRILGGYTNVYCNKTRLEEKCEKEWKTLIIKN